MGSFVPQGSGSDAGIELLAESQKFKTYGAYIGTGYGSFVNINVLSGINLSDIVNVAKKRKMGKILIECDFDENSNYFAIYNSSGYNALTQLYQGNYNQDGKNDYSGLFSGANDGSTWSKASVPTARIQSVGQANYIFQTKLLDYALTNEKFLGLSIMGPNYNIGRLMAKTQTIGELLSSYGYTITSPSISIEKGSIIASFSGSGQNSGAGPIIQSYSTAIEGREFWCKTISIYGIK